MKNITQLSSGFILALLSLFCIATIEYISIMEVKGITQPSYYLKSTARSDFQISAEFPRYEQAVISDELFKPEDNPEGNIQELVNAINSRVVSKDTVGLNVHWTLKGNDHNYGKYEEYLMNSGVRWVREQFQTKTHPESNLYWQRKYSKVLNSYKELNIHVVGVLAYGTDPNNEFSQPDLVAWEKYVKELVTLYGSYVKVWEVWNEPDSITFLNPNTIEHYVPILKTAYTAIKSVDPDAIVLGGSFTWPNANFTEQLYQQAGGYFDELALHTYYCTLYFKNNSHRHLQAELDSVKTVIDKYQPGAKVWITEAGCSSGTEEISISNDQQRQYVADMTQVLLNTGWVQNILIYNFRNTFTNNVYEDNFGLVDLAFGKKPLWDWFVALPGGSAVAPVGPQIVSGSSFFAYDSRIRGGFNIASGNVMGDSKDEVIAGTASGMGPHVRVFDNNGNLKSQFFAYDGGLRNGVTATACDVTGDGKDEIVTAQGKGGRPVVKIFDGDGTVINNGFNVLDGKFTGGVNLSCGDTNGDGTSEIVVAAMQGGGPHVLVYNVDGKILTNFMAYDPNFRGGINVTTVDADGDGRDEIITGPQWGAPHVQIFQIRPNELKRLSPGFYAFDPGYRGGVSVSGVDIDGDGIKEIVVGVGDNATPLVKVYNIREEWQKEFFVYATNFLGGVNLTGGDVDGDGKDELMVIPRAGGGSNLRIINVDEV